MILVHGGAGRAAPARHDRLRAGVRAAAAAGRALLDRGGSALDAVVAAVRVLEDDPEFGAGLGSALTRDGTVETSASVMDGARRRIGAVAAVPDLGTPVIVARAVLELGEHAILSGPPALRFAGELGITAAAPGALITERARVQFGEARARGDASKISHEDGGTVGAVARDRNGGFAAATSSGGQVYRRAGGVSDSAIPGAGTWADTTVAISTTGDDEAILRVALAHNIAMRVAGGAGLRSAAKAALHDLKQQADGIAGVIVMNEDSWAALQVGPTMPVAWCDDRGASDAIGFEL